MNDKTHKYHYVDPSKLTAHAVIKEMECKEAGLSYDELANLAEEIRFVVTGGRGVTMEEYIRLSSEINYSKFGYRKLKALHNEPTLSSFFPHEIYEILKEKGKGKAFILFNESDVDFLINNSDKGAKWLIKRFYSGRFIVYHKAKELGIIFPDSHKPFTPQEEEFIRNNVGKGTAWIAKRLGRPTANIRSKAARLGLKFSIVPVHKYSPYEDAYIKKYRNRGSRWLSNYMNLPVESILRRARKLDIIIPHFKPNGKKFCNFSEKEDLFIIKNAGRGMYYLTHSLNRTVGSVSGRIERLRKYGNRIDLGNATYEFTYHDDRRIKKWADKGLSYLADKLKLSEEIIGHRAKILGITLSENNNGNNS